MTSALHAHVPLHKRGDPERVSALHTALESRAAELLILLLVLCDVAFVVTEAGVDSKIFCVNGQLVEKSPELNVKPKELLELGAQERSQHSYALPGVSLLQNSARVKKLPLARTAQENEVLVCASPEDPSAQKITGFCHVASIVILSFFLLELLLKICLHGKHFFESGFEVLDLVVVAVSLVCDAVLQQYVEGKGEKLETMQALGVLLIVLRCWRIVRIVHGFYEIQYLHDERSSKEGEEKDAKLRSYRAQIAKLQDILRANNLNE